MDRVRAGPEHYVIQMDAMPPRRNAITAPKIFAKERQRKALELRKLGLTYQQIADELKWEAAETARQAVKTALEEMPMDAVGDLRAVQLERCNAFLFVLQPMIQQGSETAINTALRVMDKMDRYLGTEVPERHETTMGGSISIDGEMVHSGGVLAIPVDKEQYIAGLKKMAGYIDATSTDTTDATNTPEGISAALDDMDDDEEIVMHKRPTPIPDVADVIDVVDVAEAEIPRETEPCQRYVLPGRNATGNDACKRCGYSKGEHDG